MRKINECNLEFEVREEINHLEADLIDDLPEQFKREGRKDTNPDSLLISEDSISGDLSEMKSAIQSLFGSDIYTNNRETNISNLGNICSIKDTERENINNIKDIYGQISDKGYGITYMTNHQSNIHDILDSTLQHRNNDILYTNQNKYGININLFMTNYDDNKKHYNIMHTNIIYELITQDILTEKHSNYSDTELNNLYNNIKDNINNKNGYNNIVEDSPKPISEDLNNINKNIKERLFKGNTELDINNIISDNYILTCGRENPVGYNKYIQRYIIACLINTDTNKENHTVIIQGLPDLVLRSDYSDELLDSNFNLIFTADPRFDKNKLENITEKL